jgi:sugar phosphate isomerase/epimerase
MAFSLSRRTFLGASAAAGVLVSRASARNLAPSRIGVQLYTLRSVMPAKDAEVLHQIAEIGYREIEGDYDTLMRVSSMAKADGLTAVSCHVPTESVLGSGAGGPSFEKILTDLKGIGVEYAVVPYIGEELRKPDILDAFGEKMNKAGALAKKIGLQLAYHNHAFEWGQMGGKLVFDRMFAHTDPGLVKLEVDVFWLSVGGVDPVHFLETHAGRIALLHLKDKAAAQKVQYNERVPRESFKEVGSGVVAFPAILKTAEHIGVKHYFVEQDQTPGDPIASLRMSYQYLTSLRA